MVNKLILEIKNMDNSIKSIMKAGFKFSLVLSLFSAFILYLHSTYPFSHIAYDAGLILLKNSLFFATCSLIFSLATNTIKKDLY